jgi:glycine cleavage system H protein
MPSPTDRPLQQNEHEWVQVDGDTGTVGITEYAQDQLGDIVFVECRAGDRRQYMEKFGEIESVKAVSDSSLLSPAKSPRINATLADNPERVGDSPYGVDGEGPTQ